MASLELKDVLGPAVAVGAALLSVVNYRLSKRLSDRSLYHEGQKVLFEINKQLIADPKLWAIYDGHFVRTDPEFKEDSPAFQAKLEAFACLKINMFELVSR